MREYILSFHLSGVRVAKSLYGMITVHAVLVVLSLGDYSPVRILTTIAGTIVFISIAEAYSIIVGRHIDKKSPMHARELMRVWCESRYLFLGSISILFFFALAVLGFIDRDMAFVLSYISSGITLFGYGLYYGLGAGESWTRSILMGLFNATIVYSIIVLKSIF